MRHLVAVPHLVGNPSRRNALLTSGEAPLLPVRPRHREFNPDRRHEASPFRLPVVVGLRLLDLSIRVARGYKDLLLLPHRGILPRLPGPRREGLLPGLREAQGLEGAARLYRLNWIGIGRILISAHGGPIFAPSLKLPGPQWVQEKNILCRSISSSEPWLLPSAAWPLP